MARVLEDGLIESDWNLKYAELHPPPELPGINRIRLEFKVDRRGQRQGNQQNAD